MLLFYHIPSHPQAATYLLSVTIDLSGCPKTLWIQKYIQASFTKYAAAAAKSLQSSNAVRPHRRKPTRLRRPWVSPGKNTGVGCHFLLQCMKVKSFSHVQLFATPWTAAYQAPLPMGFSRQEYWSGLPLPSPLLSILIIILTHLCSSIYYSFLFIAESTPLQKNAIIML